VLVGAAYVLLSYSLSHEVDVALTGVARTLAERSRGSSAAIPPADIEELFRRFFGFSPWDRYFQIVDPRRHRDSLDPNSSQDRPSLSREALNNATHGLPTFETMEDLAPYPIRVLTMPVMKGNRLANVIQVGMPLQSISETRFRFLLVMAALLPIGLLLAGSGGWLLARRALQPVVRMADAAQRISAEHLNQRVDETGSGDELDHLAKTLNQMLSRLDAAFSQIRQFSASASHELQTPLTILKGELEVALRSPRTPEEYQAALNSSLEEVDRIAQLVEGLLLLSRAEAGVLKMDRQPVDLTQLLEEVYSRLKFMADSRSIELQLGSMEPVSISGDREHLRRLLLNLTDNAIKYTEPGGMVALSVRNQAYRACILIEDTGIGISAEELEKVFQPFYRTNEARSKGSDGTGLGLCIARSIAVAHGGNIELESRPGEGTAFRVFLPIASSPIYGMKESTPETSRTQRDTEYQ
jgi:two-component system, OmpR family, sensor kinase